MSRAAQYTIEKKKREHFSDFLINFDKNPVTGYLAKAVDRQAIEGSMRNIILTNKGDWPFESKLGSNIKASMFELNDERALLSLRNDIIEALTLFEPRIRVEEVAVTSIPNAPNSVFVSIFYTIINIADENFQFDVIVSRVR